MILGSGLIQAAGWTPTWLIRDEFTDTVAAGSVDGTAATPGPGTRAVTDTESNLSVGGGVLAFVDGKTVLSETDPVLTYGTPITRGPGMAFVGKITEYSVRINAFGFSTKVTPTLANDFESEIRSASNVFRAQDIRSPATFAALESSSGAETYILCVVLCTTGAHHFIKGGAFTDWTYVWKTTIASTSTLYATIGNYAGTLTADYLRVTQLPAPFDTDDGLTTDSKSGSVAAGTTFSHEADCLIEFTATTLPSADNIDVQFRVQDASNYWICRVNSSGDISLQEVVAGSATQRSNTAGVVSNGHRIVIIADGSTIRLYSNNVLRSTYASATNFDTATAGEVDALGTGGVVPDLKTWPRTLSGTAASILNKASA